MEEAGIKLTTSPQMTLLLLLLLLMLLWLIFVNAIKVGVPIYLCHTVDIVVQFCFSCR